MISEEVCQQEVERLHAFFQGWFDGSIPKEEFEESCAKALHPSFRMIPPSGNLVEREPLLQGLKNAHGSKENGSFFIEIKNCRLFHQTKDTLLMSYEEWQTKSGIGNKEARISTVSFVTDGHNGIQWLFVHETWMPGTEKEGVEL